MQPPKIDYVWFLRGTGNWLHLVNSSQIAGDGRAKERREDYCELESSPQLRPARVCARTQFATPLVLRVLEEPATLGQT